MEFLQGEDYALLVDIGRGKFFRLVAEEHRASDERNAGAHMLASGWALAMPNNPTWCGDERT